jgi:hypothetical protein
LEQFQGNGHGLAFLSIIIIPHLGVEILAYDPLCVPPHGEGEGVHGVVGRVVHNGVEEHQVQVTLELLRRPSRNIIINLSLLYVQGTVPNLITILLQEYFLSARVCWPLLCLCRPFCIFERYVDKNPESYRSKQARYQHRHPSLYFCNTGSIGRMCCTYRLIYVYRQQSPPPPFSSKVVGAILSLDVFETL